MSSLCLFSLYELGLGIQIYFFLLRVSLGLLKAGQALRLEQAKGPSTAAIIG